MNITFVSIIFVNFIMIYLRYDYRILSTLMESKLSVLAIIIAVAGIITDSDTSNEKSKKPILFLIVSLLLTFQSLTTL